MCFISSFHKKHILFFCTLFCILSDNPSKVNNLSSLLLIFYTIIYYNIHTTFPFVLLGTSILGTKHHQLYLLSCSLHIHAAIQINFTNLYST